MKAIFISFNQAYYEMILSIMDRNNIRGFTYWEEVQGRGSDHVQLYAGGARRDRDSDRFCTGRKGILCRAGCGWTDILHQKR